jgi:FkbM family methyltransferase
MPSQPRKIAFVVAATDQGTLIVNRFDQHVVAPDRGYGVGLKLLERSSYDAEEVALLRLLLDLRRQEYGDGVVALDCGANIGVHTVEWAKHMTGWGTVVAIEAQERIYYALAGNIAINNCFNAFAIHAALASKPGMMKIPSPDYLAPASFGSLELKKRDNTEFIGQQIDYSESKMVDVRVVSIDSFNLPRLDVIKMDIEGMECEALAGAHQMLARLRPLLLVEVMKTDKAQLRALLESFGYSLYAVGINALAVHQDDKCRPHINFTPQGAA